MPPKPGWRGIRGRDDDLSSWRSVRYTEYRTKPTRKRTKKAETYCTSKEKMDDARQPYRTVRYVETRNLPPSSYSRDAIVLISYGR